MNHELRFILYVASGETGVRRLCEIYGVEPSMSYGRDEQIDVGYTIIKIARFLREHPDLLTAEIDTPKHDVG